MDNIQLTPHFKLSELCATTHKDLAKTNLEAAKKIMGRMYQLAGFAERVREIIGKPLIINSGYRCVKLNNAVGGSLASQHLYAEAIDIRVTGKTSSEVFRILAASDLKYDQLILERAGNAQWVHVSIGSKKEKLIYKNGKYTRI